MKKVLTITIVFLFIAVSAFAGSLKEGKDAYENKDYKTAFRIFSELAKQGDVKAQNKLGIMYHEGEGVKQDYKQAFICFQKAAEQGYAGAQTNFGRMYFNGEGVKQDYRQAVQWWTKAASQGNAEAQNILEELHEIEEDIQSLNSKIGKR